MDADVGRYFDHHSSTPLSAEARRVLAEGLERFGDPLRLHREGREARRALEAAREQVAAAISAQPDEIVFTSGGTESIAMALGGAGTSIVTEAVEHPAVLAGAGLGSTIVGVDEHGRLDLDAFAAAVRRPQVRIASIQHSNHEVGTMQPVAEAASIAREAGVTFHTDACQTAGRLPIDVTAMGVDLLSISGHKLGGPPGTGALYVRRGVSISSRLHGDDRERRRRAGLQHTVALAAMAAAVGEAVAGIADSAARSWSLTTRLRRAIDAGVAGARTHGHPTQRAPHLVCFSIESVDPEVLLMSLDQRGFRLDAGAVSASAPHQPSPVLAAMGSPGVVALRASVGPRTAEKDVDALSAALAELASSLSRVGGAASG